MARTVLLMMMMMMMMRGAATPAGTGVARAQRPTRWPARVRYRPMWPW